MSLDGQNILIVEKSDEDSMRTVVILDSLTLFKTSEFQVSISNPVHAEGADYRENDDYYSCEEVDVCKTSYTFPKYVCWSQGQYLLVGIGAKPRSKVYYEFRVYDCETKRVQQTIMRAARSALGGCIMEVNNHPTNEDLLIFLVKDTPNQYTIVEFDIFSNRPELEFTINAYDIDFIKINEDLSTVFLAKYEPKYKGSYTGSHKLYGLSYGTDHDLSGRNNDDLLGDLGSSIYNKQIIGDSIIVSYRLSDDTEMIETFNRGGTTLPIKSDFPIYGNQRYTIDQDNNYVYSYVQSSESSPVIYLLGKGKSVENASYSLAEFNYFRFTYPYLFILKGQTEVIIYNFSTRSYKYFKLPAPVIVDMKDNRNTMSMMGLMDLGDEYLPFFLGCETSYNGQLYNLLKCSKKKIKKEKLKY